MIARRRDIQLAYLLLAPALLLLLTVLAYPVGWEVWTSLMDRRSSGSRTTVASSAILSSGARRRSRSCTPQRRPFPASWQPDLQARPEGVVIFIRRTSETGTVSLLGRTFEADPLWPHRLVRCAVDLSAETVRFRALRRREPNHQSLLREAPYVFPRKAFHE